MASTRARWHDLRVGRVAVLHLGERLPEAITAASGATEMVLSPVAFLRRLAARVPPPGGPPRPLFGVLAPSARLRPLVVPGPPSA